MVERDHTYEHAATSHTNSCMRQQFSRELNVRISQFAADFVKNLQHYMGEDPRVPNLPIQSYGYLYLADNEAFATTLQQSQRIQAECGAGTRYLTYLTLDASQTPGSSQIFNNHFPLDPEQRTAPQAV